MRKKRQGNQNVRSGNPRFGWTSKFLRIFAFTAKKCKEKVINVTFSQTFSQHGYLYNFMTFDLRKIHETEKIKSVNFLEIRILKIEKKINFQNDKKTRN